jgi:hypothetical protein
MYRCIFAYPFITVVSLLLPCIIHLFLHLLSTNYKCTQPCYFSPATQTCCLEGEDGLEFFDEEFKAMCCPRLSFLWCYGVFRCSVPLRVIIVFGDTIYVIIIILYS